MTKIKNITQVVSAFNICFNVGQFDPIGSRKDKLHMEKIEEITEFLIECREKNKKSLFKMAVDYFQVSLRIHNKTPKTGKIKTLLGYSSTEYTKDSFRKYIKNIPSYFRTEENRGRELNAELKALYRDENYDKLFWKTNERYLKGLGWTEQKYLDKMALLNVKDEFSSYTPEEEAIINWSYLKAGNTVHRGFIE